ncbi:MAG: amidohydrolase family protein [Candidatus Paceibacterota bacterium]|jgi:5-methylthioadenosine/S-adenosylhomocysteine deaminase|nr:amidohydrolase family protein [bacterium]
MKTRFNLPLVNAHTHAAMIAFRGLGEDLPLDKWLNDCIWPMEAKSVNPEFVYTETKKAIDEMYDNGIRAFMDMYFFEKEVAKAATEKKFLVVVGEGLLDIKGQEIFEKDFESTKSLLEEYKTNTNVFVSVAPHSPYTVNEDNLKRSKKLAKDFNAIYQIHVSETKKEIEDSLKNHGLTPIAYLDKIGVLDEKTTLIHCTWLTKEDVSIIAEKGCSVVHCPLSNLKLGSGISPVSDLIDAGINVAIGTDGAASSNRLDVWEAGKFTALLQKGINCNSSLLPANKIVEMMTVGGMKALGIERIGEMTIEKIKTEVKNNSFNYLYQLQAQEIDFM